MLGLDWTGLDWTGVWRRDRHQQQPPPRTSLCSINTFTTSSSPATLQRRGSVWLFTDDCHTATLPPCKRLILIAVWSVWSLAAPLQAALVAHAFIVGHIIPPVHLANTDHCKAQYFWRQGNIFFSHFLITTLGFGQFIRIRIDCNLNSHFNLLIFRLHSKFETSCITPALLGFQTLFLSCLGLKVLCEIFFARIVYKVLNWSGLLMVQTSLWQ